MVGPLDCIELHQLFKTPLLITESAKDFADLSVALTQEIKPRGIVEQIYVADIAALVWEILRLRRRKTVIVNTAFNNAVFDIVKRLSSARRLLIIQKCKPDRHARDHSPACQILSLTIRREVDRIASRRWTTQFASGL